MRSEKILMMVILLALIIFPNCQSLKSVPDELVGTWTTEAQEYRGIFLDLKPRTIQFGKKDGSVDSFNVTNIKRKEMSGDWIRYTIFYRDQDLKKYEFPIVYNPHNHGIVRFINKEQNTWIRESS